MVGQRICRPCDLENLAKNAMKTCENLIIGGTIKAATSSVFTYLSAHPDVCGSSVKETFFFTHEHSGDRERDLRRYRKYFTTRRGVNVAVEASPNYLGYKENVAPRIKSLLPDAKLLFILRNPVDRLYSHYHFAIGKLQVPADLKFENYVDLCERYSSAKLLPADAGIMETHLRALEIGKYSRYLRNFYDAFPPEQIKVVFFEHLMQRPVEFMSDICRFVGVDPVFFQDFKFNRINVTFSARRKPLHRVAMLLNRALESLLRQRPDIKMRLVQIYKRLNQNREGYSPMADPTRARLVQYYLPFNRELEGLLANQELPRWIKGMPAKTPEDFLRS